MKKMNIGATLAAAAVFAVLGFSSPVLAAGPAAVNLGSAANFAILAKSGISATGATSVTGDIGVSPVAATSITGFGLILSTDTTYSTTPIVVGKVYAASYTTPTPSNLTTAIGDMETAYTDASGRSNPTATELGAGNIGGLTITPGLYKWGTAVSIPSDVVLSGSSNDIWIFQIAQTLTVSSGAKVVLAGGAQANNVFWVVGGQVTVGTTAEISGNIIGKTAIVLNTGAKLSGRALAQTAVTLDANMVVSSGAQAVASAPAATPTPVTTSVQTTTNTSSSQTASSQPSSSGSLSSSNSYSNGSNVSTAASTNASTNTSVTQTTVKVTGTTVSTVASSFGQQVKAIAMNLGKGSRSSDVSVLQQFLMSQDNGPSTEALVKVGATGYFGEITRAALAEYQARVGIVPALGNFGPITRMYIGLKY